MDLDRFRYYTAWHSVANERGYAAPADPWKLLPVAPADVERCTNELRLDVGLGRVQGGDWDRDGDHDSIRETTVYRGLEQRFQEEYDWEETALYRRAEATFESEGSFRGYDSLEAFRNIRCEYLDDLFRSIRDDGYRPNEAASHAVAADDNPFEAAYANHLEPLVVIGRSGEIYWTEGYHRFSIASILGVDMVPVYVLCRHGQWQRIRDRVHKTPEAEGPPELEPSLGHPDLQDVRSASW
jgi:hypothetical protein